VEEPAITDESSGATYVMADSDYTAEVARLRMLEGLRDRETAACIDTIGIAEGWRCVDLGAGAGSVARLLADLAGPDGHVVAADLDPRFLDDFAGPGRSVLAHDITVGPVPPADFDFAHCRAVLTHVTDLATAVTNMAGSLRPGGWLLCEEPDYVSMEPCDPDHPRAEDLKTFRAVMTLNGRQDGYVGRKLFSLFEQIGLRDVQSQGTTALVVGGSPGAQFRIHGLHSTRHLLIESGLFDDAAVDRLIDMFEDPTFAYLELTWMATWGRVPGG
jgi:SAM-dependent methyltransferase